MRKLIPAFAFIGVVFLTIPSCSENDDFADVVVTTDLEKVAPSNGDDEKKDSDDGPG